MPEWWLQPHYSQARPLNLPIFSRKNNGENVKTGHKKGSARVGAADDIRG